MLTHLLRSTRIVILIKKIIMLININVFKLEFAPKKIGIGPIKIMPATLPSPPENMDAITNIMNPKHINIVPNKTMFCAFLVAIPSPSL